MYSKTNLTNLNILFKLWKKILRKEKKEKVEQPWNQINTFGFMKKMDWWGTSKKNT